jgi:hypothetical protein
MTLQRLVTLFSPPKLGQVDDLLTGRLLAISSWRVKNPGNFPFVPKSMNHLILFSKGIACCDRIHRSLVVLFHWSGFRRIDLCENGSQ